MYCLTRISIIISISLLCDIILDISVNFTPIHRTAPNADQIFIGDPATIRQKVDLDGPPPEVQEDSSETADVSSGVGTAADPNSESPNTFY